MCTVTPERHFEMSVVADVFLLYKVKDSATSLHLNENANDWNETLQACEEDREKKKSSSSASVLSSQANTQI